MKVKLALLYVVFLLGCQTIHSPSFEITSHRLKVQVDPLSQKLAVTDTMAITFHKHVNSVYFLLEECMQVEHVGIGNQDFKFEQTSDFNAGDYVLNSDFSLFADKKLVKVDIPKSLFPKNIEVWYSGNYQEQASNDELYLWHPVQPDVLATFSVTALCPKLYECSFSAERTLEQENDKWRITRWQHEQPTDCLKFSIVSL